MRALLATLVLLCPALAFAFPPHSVIEVKPGDTTFVRLFEVEALGVQDPSIATAEHLPSDEILVTGKKAGTTDIVALAGGKLVGIRVHVRTPAMRTDEPTDAKLDAALKACPVHKLVGDGPNQQLGVTPSTPACRAALFTLFQTDRFLTKQISVDHDAGSLQAQVAELETAVKAAGVELKLHYQGATLVLQGTLTAAQASKAIVAIYSHAVGGVPLDETDFEIEEPDAGAPAPEAPAPRPPVR